MFGNTPTGIIILDVILVAMGMVLTPILWGIYKRLGDTVTNSENTIKIQTECNQSLIKVVEELNDARVRDKDLEGRMKGLDEKMNRLERRQ